MIVFEGKNYETISIAAKAFGLSPTTLRSRLRNGWTIEQALTTPSLRKNEVKHHMAEAEQIQPQEEVKAVQIPNDIEPRLIPRCEVLKMLGYKTVQGFVNFLKRAPDFPAAIKRSGSFNSRVFYNGQDVIDWINQQSAR